MPSSGTDGQVFTLDQNQRPRWAQDRLTGNDQADPGTVVGEFTADPGQIKQDLDRMSGLPGYSEYEQRAQIETDAGGWSTIAEWISFRAGSPPETR